MVATYLALTWAHWGGLALLVVGYILSVSRGTISEVMVWGARLQLLLGLLLVAAGEIGQVRVFDHMMIGVKLVIALLVVVFAEISRAKAAKGQGNQLFTHAAAAATALNVIVALVWL